jgi:hypothetical protein
MAELADAPDLGSGGFSVQVRFLLPAPKEKPAKTPVFLDFMRFLQYTCLLFYVLFKPEKR